MSCKSKLVFFGAAVCLMFTGAVQASLLISEVDAAGSSSAYSADWFELTNTGPSPVNLSGWKMDDSSNSFASAVAFRGVTSIAAGQAVVFAEGNATGTTDATIQAAFINSWFGGAAPAGFTMGFYGGSGVGLSSTAGDGVFVFDSGGALQAGVSFGATPTGSPIPTLDNTAGLTGLISTASANGVNGAFVSSVGTEVGSPGVVVPEPTTSSLLSLGASVLMSIAGSVRRRCV